MAEREGTDFWKDRMLNAIGEDEAVANRMLDELRAERDEAVARAETQQARANEIRRTNADTWRERCEHAEEAKEEARLTAQSVATELSSLRDSLDKLVGDLEAEAKRCEPWVEKSGYDNGRVTAFRESAAAIRDLIGEEKEE